MFCLANSTHSGWLGGVAGWASATRVRWVTTFHSWKAKAAGCKCNSTNVQQVAPLYKNKVYNRSIFSFQSLRHPMQRHQNRAIFIFMARQSASAGERLGCADRCPAGEITLVSFFLAFLPSASHYRPLPPVGWPHSYPPQSFCMTSLNVTGCKYIHIHLCTVIYNSTLYSLAPLTYLLHSYAQQET